MFNKKFWSRIAIRRLLNQNMEAPTPAPLTLQYTGTILLLGILPASSVNLELKNLILVVFNIYRYEIFGRAFFLHM
jgi:hypothetical protein